MTNEDYERAPVVIAQLQALPDYDEDAVLGIIDGIGYTLFQALDEGPGQFDYRYLDSGWHWKLRRARNSAATFFDVINSRERAEA